MSSTVRPASKARPIDRSEKRHTVAAPRDSTSARRPSSAPRSALTGPAATAVRSAWSVTAVSLRPSAPAAVRAAAVPAGGQFEAPGRQGAVADHAQQGCFPQDHVDGGGRIQRERVPSCRPVPQQGRGQGLRLRGRGRIVGQGAQHGGPHPDRASDGELRVEGGDRLVVVVPLAGQRREAAGGQPTGGQPQPPLRRFAPCARRRSRWWGGTGPRPGGPARRPPPPPRRPRRPPRRCRWRARPASGPVRRSRPLSTPPAVRRSRPRGWPR